MIVLTRYSSEGYKGNHEIVRHKIRPPSRSFKLGAAKYGASPAHSTVTFRVDNYDTPSIETIHLRDNKERGINCVDKSLCLINHHGLQMYGAMES
jgi:hypothetical protein